MMRKVNVLLALTILAILVSSGCVNTAVLGGNRPEDVVKSIPEVQEFLSSHPDCELSALYKSEGYIRSVISDMTDKCGPYFKLTDYWYIILSDPHTAETLHVWMEKDTNQLACLYGEGVDSPLIIIPGPEKAPIKVSGFSNLEVGGKGTEFIEGKLYLTIKNPKPERISVKKVTAQYLDDIIVNITESGILRQGESYQYVFDFSRTIDNGLFWIDVEISYDEIDENRYSQKSRGSVINGLDTNRILLCSGADIELARQNFYFVTRIFEVELANTGDIDLRIKTYWRNVSGLIEQINEPVDIGIGDSEVIEVTGLTKAHESIILRSEECPGENIAVFTSDIAGV